jgi:hypothetical protein
MTQTCLSIAPFLSCLDTNPQSRFFHGPWGIYDPNFFATHEHRGKWVKEFYTLIYSFDLAVVNDRRSPNKISSIDQYLFFESSRDSATSAPLQSPCTQSDTSSKLLKRVSLWGDLSRVSPEMDKGIGFPRNGLNFELIQCVHIHINLFIDMIHTWPFHYKHATTISESKHYTGSLILRPFIKLHRL